MARPNRLLLAAMAVATSVVSPLVLAGCATGQRPTLVTDTTIVTDPVADALVGTLELAEDATFTATYDITSTLTNETVQATVVQSGLQLRVTVGAVDYTRDGTIARTCTLGTTDCTDGIDETRVSNFNITHTFWGPSFAKRLQLDAARSVSDTTGRSEAIAGQSASCVDVTVPAADGAGVVVYCALTAGPLARYNGVDARIELTSFSPTVDPAQLTL